MAITRAAGSTSEIINVYFRDTRSVSSTGMANVSASSITFSWCRDNSVAASSGICSSQTVVGTYSTASLTQIGSTSTLGWYQFGLHNGALASGKSAIVHFWSTASTAGVSPFSVEIDLLGNINPVSVSSSTILLGVSTLSVPVGVSSASVNLGVSTLAASVSSVTGSVNISSYSRDAGVSTIAVSEKLVGVSTISAAQKLVGVSTMTTPVGVSSASVNLGVSTLAVPVGVSSASVNLGVSTLAVSVSSVTGSVNVSSASVNLGVSTLATSVDVSSSIMVSSNIVQVNNIAVQGAGIAGDAWRPV